MQTKKACEIWSNNWGPSMPTRLLMHRNRNIKPFEKSYKVAGEEFSSFLENTNTVLDPLIKKDLVQSQQLF